jgi:crotonobetainyl-CoA:carnitine CoA-transferase CaiB-like acyl-CoA transferase
VDRPVSAPLEHLQVVDLTTGVAGPYCTKLFADAGADVVKVEPASGDPLRRYAATTEVPDGEDGALFRYLNAGKRSIVAGLGPRVDELLAGADLLVSDRFDLDVEGVRARHPHLVVLTITPFGCTGPLAGAPATDLTIQAESGAILFRGPAGRPPLQAGGRIAEVMAGSFAAPAALAAVLRARAGGPGEHVDVSHHDVMAVAGSNYSDVLHDVQGRPPVEEAMRILDTPGIEQAKDGLVGFNTNTGQMFQMFLLLIERADLMDVPAYASLANRIAMGADWQRCIDDWVRTRTVDEVVEAAAALRIPVGPVHDGASIASDEQLVARGALARGDDGLLRPLPPYRIDGERPPRTGRAPRLGEHDDVVEPRPARPAPSRPAELPLAGLFVVDLTSWWVGALATQHLAMLGADVVHVESTSHPDGMRLTGHFTARSEAWWEWGHMFTAANAGKRGITLDVGAEDGLALLHRLVAGADVLVENFSPRVAERWGLDHAGALARNPDLVYVRMPAFGLDGPWRDRPAFAQIIEPMSTMASITGFPDGLPVSKGGLPDPVTAAHGTWAALLGLAARQATGRGVAVESVMLEASLNACAQPLLEHDAYGEVMGLTGNRSAHAAPQGVYRCGDDRWLALSVADDAHWRGLVAALGQPGWSLDADLRTARGRRRRHDDLDRHLATWAAGRAAEDAAADLLAAGVPAAPCRDPRGVSAHPQYEARRLYERLEHPVVGEHLVPGATFRYASVDRWLHRAAPTLGQHTAEVLAERLGLTPEEIESLVARGVTGTRPVGT